jgi:DNA-binding NarL/FixJ family response regulator
MTKIRVLLVDDHTILREELRALLGCYNDAQVVGEARSGVVALEQVQALKPDIVVMDIAMPVMDDLRFTRCLGEMFPETHLLVLTQDEDKEYVLPLMRAGVSGFVLKRTLGNDLIEAIRKVALGETFVSPSIGQVQLEESK